MKNIVVLGVIVPINAHVQWCMQIYIVNINSQKSRIMITRVARARAIWRRDGLAGTGGVLGGLSCNKCKPSALINAVVFVYMTVMLI